MMTQLGFRVQTTQSGLMMMDQLGFRVQATQSGCWVHAKIGHQARHMCARTPHHGTIPIQHLQYNT